MPSARRHARARGGGSTVQHSNPKKRSRMTFNKGQKRALEEAFRRAGPQYGKCVIDTAHALGVPMVRVRKWFDNRTQVTQCRACTPPHDCSGASVESIELRGVY